MLLFACDVYVSVVVEVGGGGVLSVVTAAESRDVFSLQIQRPDIQRLLISRACKWTNVSVKGVFIRTCTVEGVAIKAWWLSDTPDHETDPTTDLIKGQNPTYPHFIIRSGM